MKKRRITVIGFIILAMTITTAIPAFASAPKKESTEYLGSGKVEVEFTSNVKYKKPSVTVKDTSGKKYSASIYHKDNDEVKFKIKNYKAGKKYKYTIKNVRKAGTSKYGNVTGSVSIPAKSISGSKALDIAIKDAVSNYGIDKTTVFDKDYDSEGSYYEVDFNAQKPNDYVVYEYEYRVKKSNGSISSSYEEIDD